MKRKIERDVFDKEVSEIDWMFEKGKCVNVLKEWWLIGKKVEWMLKMMKWKNGEKWNEC